MCHAVIALKLGIVAKLLTGIANDRYVILKAMFEGSAA